MSPLPPTIHRAKLRRPALGQGLISRPRLSARLERALHTPLTLISAPAGFGKTTLLAEWTATLSTPSAWLTADAGDRDVQRFVAHLIAALEPATPGIDVGETLAMLHRPRATPAVDIGEALADGLLALARDILLIIDDYHAAASPEVEGFVGGLLHYLPPTVHLVLATRSDPTLPLARMRVHSQIVEMRGDDLRFTDDEAGSLLAGSGGTLDPALAAPLRELTGGWVAALRLIALARPETHEPARIAEDIAGDKHLMDFLVEEILSRQPRDVQDFLLRTAILELVSAPLADALTEQTPHGRSRTLLESLAREGLFFAPEGDDGVWFRHHPLFRSLLRHQLESRFTAPALQELHARAAAWFAAQGQIDEAIRHFLVAENETAAASLVERQVQRVMDEEDWPSLARYLTMLPVELIQHNPNLLLARAYVSQLSGRFASVREILREVRNLVHRMDGDPISRAAVLAECDALELGQTLDIEQDPEVGVIKACAAADRIPADRRFVRGMAYIVCGLALQSAGRTEEATGWLSAVADREAERIDAGSIRALMGLLFVHRQAGNYFECQQVSAHLLDLAERHGLPVSAGWARWTLGWIAYEHNALETALAHFEAIAVDWKRLHFGCVGDSLFGLALAYQASGMPLDARAAMRRLTEAVHELHSLAYLPSISLFEARLALLRGDAQPTLESISASDGSLEGNSLLTFEHEILSRVKVLIAHGTPASLATADGDVARLLVAAEAGCHRARLVEILALAALIRDRQGQREAALACLQRSLDLGEPAGFCRTYVDLGPAIAPLLREVASRRELAAYAHRLLAVIETEASGARERATPAAASASVHVLELLTIREAEVLNGLCRRLSYQEIADELFISVHTVKSHTNHIYEKLGVANRRQALSKAEALGLAPRGTPVNQLGGLPPGF